jgi:hypothetical protein
MLANDKVGNTVNIDDNVNTRDQRNAGIWLIVLMLVFLGFLCLLGLAHAPRNPVTEDQQQVAPLSGNVGGQEGGPSNDFSVNAPIGPLELPGTAGQPQHFVSGHGNTPVPPQGVSPGVSPNTAENSQSFSRAQSGTAPSDAMPTGKNYKNGMEGGSTAGSNANGSNASGSNAAGNAAGGNAAGGNAAGTTSGAGGKGQMPAGH